MAIRPVNWIIKDLPLFAGLPAPCIQGVSLLFQPTPANGFGRRKLMKVYDL